MTPEEALRSLIKERSEERHHEPRLHEILANSAAALTLAAHSMDEAEEGADRASALADEVHEEVRAADWYDVAYLAFAGAMEAASAD